ncbi:MAG TPA: glycoside hydrolase family 20 zincin-like fold domain-containing protein, partial [Streptomyces sp.]|nr:glycoside hydrolase family 20 zincin-like fold domain-containing protein [Streptomyces sp.]
MLAPLLLVVAAGATSIAASPATAAQPAPKPRPLGQVVPAPASVSEGGPSYALSDKTRIRVDGGSNDAHRIGSYLADVLRPSTGYALPVTNRDAKDGIRLRLSSERSLGAEGYRLDSGRHGVIITAARPAGLFHGVQTLRQLLPPAVEKDSVQP